MPIGTIVYSPAPRFAFPRSYVKQIHMRTNNDNIPFMVGDLITIPSINFPNITQYIRLKPQFIPWHSNRVTLDWLVQDWYYVIAPNPTQNPYGGGLSYEYDSSVQTHVLKFTTDSPNTSTRFVLSPAPLNYWTPPELGG